MMIEFSYLYDAYPAKLLASLLNQSLPLEKSFEISLKLAIKTPGQRH